MNAPQFTHSPIECDLFCLQFLVIMYKAAENIYV